VEAVGSTTKAASSDLQKGLSKESPFCAPDPFYLVLRAIPGKSSAEKLMPQSARPEFSTENSTREN